MSKYIEAKDLKPGMHYIGADKYAYKVISVAEVKHGFHEVRFNLPDVEGTGANWRSFKASQQIEVID